MVLLELKKIPRNKSNRSYVRHFHGILQKTIEILKKTYINEEIYHVLALENPIMGRWQFSLN